MSRGPLFQNTYKPQFSGHETFPLRHGWLKKVYDAVEANEGQTNNSSLFLDDDAIARFGVGKNMVASMRHWAMATGVINDENDRRSLQPTPLGRRLFAARGLDPFLENPASLWLLHWALAGRPNKTTWYWAFNNFQQDIFEREHLCKGLERLASERGWTRVASMTIKRDVDCFVRTYVARYFDRDSYEETLESPLTELGLIKPVGKRDGFRLLRGAKPSLGLGVFTYALIDFWGQHSTSSTMTFETIAHEPGSPGRVFLIEENDLVDRLQEVNRLTNGAYQWSETAGLKQLIRTRFLSKDELLDLISSDYVMN